MKWACILLVGGFVNAGEVVTVSPSANMTSSGASRSAGSEVWHGRGGTKIFAARADIAGWVSTIAKGERVTVTPRGNDAWNLRGPDGKSGEILPTTGGYWIKYGTGRWMVIREGARSWCVLRK